MTLRAPSGLVEPSPPPIFALVSSPPPPRSSRPIPRRSRGLLSSPRELRRAGLGATVSLHVGRVPRPQKGRERTRLDSLSLPVCSASRIVHGSAQTPNSGDLLVAGNGAPPAPSSTPAGRPPLSPLIKSRPLISNPTDQGALYPFADHFAKESPKDIDFAPQSSAREKIKEFLYLFKFV